jgi:hypothetical protein
MFSEGKYNGFGVFKYLNGDIYAGEMSKGRRHGTGTYQACRGAYRGQWDRDDKHGHGVLMLADGGTFEGEWERDTVSDGEGEYRDSEGRTMRGQFKLNQLGLIDLKLSSREDDYSWLHVVRGEGSCKYGDGKEYTGKLIEGRFEEYGVLIWPNGDMYEGSFYRGVCCGQGKFTRGDGTVWKGSFKKGRKHALGKLMLHLEAAVKFNGEVPRVL